MLSRGKRDSSRRTLYKAAQQKPLAISYCFRVISHAIDSGENICSITSQQKDTVRDTVRNK
jgi:hypothetical protein